MDDLIVTDSQNVAEKHVTNLFKYLVYGIEGITANHIVRWTWIGGSRRRRFSKNGLFTVEKEVEMKEEYDNIAIWE